MPKVEWSTLTADPSQRHLIAASLWPNLQDTIQTQEVRAWLGMLSRLCQRQAVGLFGLAVTRNEDGVELDCAFELKLDADRVAETLSAHTDSTAAPWASRRTCILNEAAHKHVLSIVGLGRKHRHRSSGPTE